MSITHVLFDLGNVLVELRPVANGSAMCPALLPADQEAMKLVKDYECGVVDTDTFIYRAPDELGLLISGKNLQDHFKYIVGQWYPQTETLLRKLANQFHLGCLSNTNPLHIEALRERGPYLDLIQDCFFSHTIGCMKPEPKAYQTVLEQWDTPASQIAFLDDRLENVIAARQMGLQAYHTIGPEAVMKVCQQLLSAGA
jgi:putative hydrolase of the HAD superfamily